MKLNRVVIGIGALASLSLALSACGGSNGGSNNGGGGGSGRYGAAASPSVAAGVAVIHTTSMKIGSTTETVLKNDKNLTLYYFTPDTATTAACTGGCATIWPPLLSTGGTPVADPALSGTLTLIAGTNQVVYNGHPLYTYSKDGDSGDAYGQGIAGKWFVATPGLAAAGSTATPSSAPAY